jgi:hypothetical protein
MEKDPITLAVESILIKEHDSCAFAYKNEFHAIFIGYQY